MTSVNSNNILSDKVSRALQVKTDTPAMMAALDALATISSNHAANNHSNNITKMMLTSSNNSHQTPSFSHNDRQNSNNTSSGIVDARSVRVAIEIDALQQAKLLEDELQRLVNQVQNMRSCIQNVYDVSKDVQSIIDSNITIGGGPATTTSTTSTNESNHNNSSGSDSIAISNLSVPDEEALAALLASVFKEREDALKRYETISSFMDKFDLSTDDSYLLDHYNFEDFIQLTSSTSPGGMNPSSQQHSWSNTTQNSNNGTEEFSPLQDGQAFLNALLRVCKIRKELATAFEEESMKKDFTLSKDQYHDYSDTSSSSHQQLVGATSAIRIMENLASKQEKAYERLYHFLHSYLDLNRSSVAHIPTSSSSTQQQQQQKFKSLKQQDLDDDDDDDTMDQILGHPFIRKSLKVLRYVPAYYSHTLELIAISRRSDVTRKFLLALTSGYNHRPPIEMKAHDPVNYVGDMLAFVFKTLSLESVLVKTLVVFDNDNDNDDSKSIDSDNARDGEDENVLDTSTTEADSSVLDNSNDEYDNNTCMSAHDVLNDAVSGVARPLRSRISQVIGSLARRPDDDDDHNDGIMDDDDDDGNDLHRGSRVLDDEISSSRNRLASLYSVCGLLRFYHSAILKALNKIVDSKRSKKPKVNPLIECILESLDEATRAYVTSLKVNCAMLDQFASLSQNETQTSIGNSVIMQLCRLRGSSPGFDLDLDTPDSTMSTVLSIEYLCDTVFEAIIPVCNKLDDAIAMKNTITFTKKAGMNADCSSKWERMINEKEQVLIDGLIASDTNYVLDEVGLGSIGNAIESMNAVPRIDGMAISSYPGLSQDILRHGIVKFYTSLIDPPLPTYDNIKDPMLRKYARSKVAQNLCDLYKKIYDLIQSENGGYSDLSFIEYKPEQVNGLICP